MALDPTVAAHTSALEELSAAVGREHVALPPRANEPAGANSGAPPRFSIGSPPDSGASHNHQGAAEHVVLLQLGSIQLPGAMRGIEASAGRRAEV